jgi:hypothetical protein
MVKVPRVRGSKWLTECSYIPDTTKESVASLVRRQIKDFGSPSLLEIRPHSYIGPDCELLVVVTVNGRRIAAF